MKRKGTSIGVHRYNKDDDVRVIIYSGLCAFRSCAREIEDKEAKKRIQIRDGKRDGGIVNGEGDLRSRESLIHDPVPRQALTNGGNKFRIKS